MYMDGFGIKTNTDPKCIGKMHVPICSYEGDPTMNGTFLLFHKLY